MIYQRLIAHLQTAISALAEQTESLTDEQKRQEIAEIIERSDRLIDEALQSVMKHFCLANGIMGPVKSKSAIDDIRTIATELLHQTGQFIPFLVVEGATIPGTLVPLANLPDTTPERKVTLYRIGQEMAQENNVEKLTSVFFVSKGRLSSASHPHDKIEVITIVQLHVPIKKQEATSFSIIQDPDGNFKDLVLISVPGEVYSPLPLAFAQGYENSAEPSRN